MKRIEIPKSFKYGDDKIFIKPVEFITNDNYVFMWVTLEKTPDMPLSKFMVTLFYKEVGNEEYQVFFNGVEDIDSADHHFNAMCYFMVNYHKNIIDGESNESLLNKYKSFYKDFRKNNKR